MQQNVNIHTMFSNVLTQYIRLQEVYHICLIIANIPLKTENLFISKIIPGYSFLTTVVFTVTFT